MRYTRGVEAVGDVWDRLAELQIDKVEVQKDIPKKQLEDEGIDGIERENDFKRSRAEFRRDGDVADLRRKIGRSGPC